MAAPPEVSIDNLSGKWSIDKSVSTDPKPSMKLQGIGWALRNTVALSSVTQHISMHPGESDPENGSESPVHLDILQIPTGGLSSIPKTRILDWTQPTVLKDFLFGTRTGRTRFIRGKRGDDDRMVPDITLETKVLDDKIGKILRAEILEFGEKSEGFLVEGRNDGDENGLWIHTFDIQEETQWTVEQVWGFEMINGQRHHTRRFVVADKDGHIEVGRIVFSYHGALN